MKIDVSQVKLKDIHLDADDALTHIHTWNEEQTFARQVCPCGSTAFEIIYTGSYETSGKCVKCGKFYVVHQG